MLALIYFALAVFVGDFLCRRFYQFESVAHRCAAAILVGLLVSSWFTYLAGLAFFWTSRPLLWANLLFFVAALALLTWPKWKHRIVKSAPGELIRSGRIYISHALRLGIADWLLIAGYVVLVSWMMFASFNSRGGKLKIAGPEYSDFGPNTALMQSFAVGHNFPTEYPHFSGDRIRYHFLFYFQAGNLEFLGLDPAWSLNLLSITTLVAMLIVVMTLGEVLFNSRVVGRLGSLLFFFFGSLSYIPFLQKQVSIRAAIEAVKHRARISPKHFPLSRGNLGHMVAGELSQSAAFRQRDWDFSPRVGFPGHPIPRAGGKAKRSHVSCYPTHVDVRSQNPIRLRNSRPTAAVSRKMPLRPEMLPESHKARTWFGIERRHTRSRNRRTK